MSKFSETITYNGEELEVSGEVYPAEEDTNTAASIEIESVVYKGIEVWDILETATEELEELLWKKFEGQEPDFDDNDNNDY